MKTFWGCIAVIWLIQYVILTDSFLLSRSSIRWKQFFFLKSGKLANEYDAYNPPASPLVTLLGNSCRVFLTITTSLLSVALLANAAVPDSSVTRTDVGFIDIKKDQPEVTDICWMDLKIGEGELMPQRIEISLYG
jgi:hypothetical protein